MTIKNPSKAAIAFVSIFVFFIFFISLFKGLNFYDVKLNDVRIGSLFVKIDKKIILRANSIAILPQRNEKSDVSDVYYKAYLLFKLQNVFQEINLKNVKYKNLLIREIIYKNHEIKVTFKNFSLKGVVKSEKNALILKNLSLKTNHFFVKEINGKISFKKNILFDLKGYHEGYPFRLSGNLNEQNNLNLKISSNKGDVNYENFLISYLNLNAKAKINLSSLNDYDVFVKNSRLKIKKDEKTFLINDSTFVITPKFVKFLIGKMKIPKIGPIKNFEANSLKGTYFLKDNTLIVSNAQKSSFFYKKLFFSFLNDDFIYQSPTNFNFTSKKLFLKYKDFNATSKNLLVLKSNDFFYLETSNPLVKSVYGYLRSNEITVKKEILSISRIIGLLKKIPIFLNGVSVNLKEKTGKINEIYLNGIKISPLILRLKKNQLIATAKAKNVLINEKLKQILKIFNLNLPITQLKGKNSLLSSIKYDLKNKKIHFRMDLNSSNSLYEYKNYSFGYEKLSSKIKDFNTSSKIENFFANASFGKLSLNANIKSTKSYLNALAFINKLKILNLIDIKNYPEKIVWNFKHGVIYLLNTNVIINLKKNLIDFLSLKDLIKYTPFQKIVKNGQVKIKINDKNIEINATALLKRPLILNQKNNKLLKAKITITKNDINVKNEFLDFDIKNLTLYTAIIKNADLNAKEMINVFYTIEPLTQTYSSTNSKVKVYINSVNTNFIYDNHKFLSQKANISYVNDKLKLYSKYDKSVLKGSLENGYFILYGNDYDKKELTPLLKIFNSFYKINLDFVLVKTPENFYVGKIYVNSGIVSKLKALNNIIAFINTIPSLLSLKSPGFSGKGYKIKKGFINYIYYKNILYFKQIDVQGVNLGFTGKGYINFNTGKINLKLTAIIKMKLKKIPIIGKGLSYILFGKDGNLDVKIIVTGNYDDPKVEKDIGSNIVLTPFKLFKRVITLPFNLF